MHVYPHSAQLRDTVVPHREPLRNDGAMNGCLSLWLGQKSHAESPKVGPEKEVEGVKGVCAPCGMFHVVLPTKLSLRGELHTTVIEKTIWVDLGIVLR